MQVEEIAFLIFKDEYYQFQNKDEAQTDWEKLTASLADENSPWANGNHMGDCTNEPNACNRCLVEECYEKANQYLRINKLIDKDK